MSQESPTAFLLILGFFLLQRIAEIGEKQNAMLGIDTIEVIIDTPIEIM